MCGICGIVSADRGHVTSDRLERMASIMRHRGPDDAGIWTGPAGTGAVGLGHRRLSIIDLTSAGHQPMTNEDGSLWLTYNGEIYNHREPRRELVAAGHQYHSDTDSETILHAHEEWGNAAVQRFRGMFAYGLWDARSETLTLVRDRLGVKPLYYAVVGDALVFASEIKAIFESGLVKPQPDLDAFPEYLAFGFLAGEGTMFRGVRKLPPGHILTWARGRVSIERYWTVSFDPRPAAAQGADERGLEEQLAALFQESVELRLMSDVPLGVFLSGGLDSSAIAAVTAKLLDRPLQTFSVGFESRYYSELSYAREVATHIGASHHEVVLTGQAFFDAVPRLTWHEDEPLWGTASVALYAVSELARKHVTVVLTGEGSDELFAGYDRYWMTALNARILRWYRFLPSSARALLRRGLLSQAVPERLRRSLGHTFIKYDTIPDGLMFDSWFGVFSPDWQAELAGPALRKAVEAADVHASRREVFDAARGRDVVDRFLEVDVKTSLVELLMKQDQMSMATSIESRVPFLDHKFVEFAASVPSTAKVRGTNVKRVVKESFRRILPGSIIDRPKMGFPVPWEQWLREPFMDGIVATLTDARARDRGWLNPAAVERVLADHKAGFRNNARQIWNLWGLELWARTFVDGQLPDGVRPASAGAADSAGAASHVAFR